MALQSEQALLMQGQAGAGPPDAELPDMTLGQVEDGLANMRGLVGPYKRAMQPMKVYCFGLADYLGAEWSSSRWRVAGTFYVHLTVFLLAHLVLIEYLGNWLAVAAAYAVGVAVASVVWLGIIRDHVIDDSAYRRRNIGLVAEQLQRLEQMQAVLGKGAGGDQATALSAEADSLRSVLQGLLAEMRTREVCIRKRFGSTEM